MVKAIKDTLAAFDWPPLNFLMALGVVAALCWMSRGLAPVVRAALDALTAHPERQGWLPSWLIVFVFFILLRLALMPYALVRTDGRTGVAEAAAKTLMGWRRFLTPIMDSVAVFVILRAANLQAKGALPFLNETPEHWLWPMIGMNVCLPYVMLLVCDLCLNPRKVLPGDRLLSRALLGATSWYILIYVPAFFAFSVKFNRYGTLSTIMTCLFCAQLLTTPIPVVLSLWLHQRRRGKPGTGQP